MTHDEIVRFKLYYPKEGADDNRLGIHMEYKEIEVLATLPDGDVAAEDIKTLMKSFPEILRLAGQERQIQEEVRGMGAEIDKLLDSE